MAQKTLKFFKETGLPSSLAPDAVYYIKAPGGTTFTEYVTDASGVAVPAAGGGGGGGGGVTSVNTRTGAVTLTKSDVSLGSVDNTADANKPVSTAQAAAIAVETARATAAENAIILAASGALIFKGSWDASAGTFPGTGAAQTGWFYKVSVAGTVNGQLFTVGDDVYAITNNASTTTYAANWLIVQGGITLAEVVAALGYTPTNATDLASTTDAAKGTALVGWKSTATGAVGRTLSAKLLEQVSVKDFGAVGNWSTDDTAAIQAAIDSGASSIYFPAGTYKVTSTIDMTGLFGVHVYGDGGGSNGLGTTKIYWGGSANGTIWKLKSSNFCIIERLAFQGIFGGLESNPGIGIDVTALNATGSAHYNIIRDCSVSAINGSPGQGIHLGSSTNDDIADNTFENILISNVKTALAQEGTQTVNNPLKNVQALLFSVKGFTFAAGDIRMDGCQFFPTSTATADVEVGTAALWATISKSYHEDLVGYATTAYSFPSGARTWATTIDNCRVLWNKASGTVVNYLQQGPFLFLGNTVDGSGTGTITVTGGNSVPQDAGFYGNNLASTITYAVSGALSHTNLVPYNFTNANALTAHAGGGQTLALALTAQVNRIGTVATAADSVRLPVSVAGNWRILTNGATTNAMQVFGAGTDTINDVATATGVSQAAGITTVYTCPVAGKWYATALSASGGSSGLTVGTTTITSGTSGRLLYDNAGVVGESAAVTYAASGALLTVTALAATDVPLTIKGAASQSGDLLRLTDSSNVILVKVNAGGGLTTTGTSAFTNGSFGYWNGAASLELNKSLGFAPGNIVGTSSDTFLTRDNAANTLALRNGTNAQTLNNYFSYTDGSNYTRSAWKTSTGLHSLVAESAGTGEANIDIGFLPKGTGKFGYAPGAGGTVTQVTSRTTGVTLNKPSGAITLVSAVGLATYQSFTLTNSTITATDVVHVTQQSGTDIYQIFVTNTAAGSCKISFATTGGTTTEQPVFNFAIIKAVNA